MLLLRSRQPFADHRLVGDHGGKFKILPCFRASISGSASRVKLVNATTFSICIRSISRSDWF
jgi:hypothetical protein